MVKAERIREITSFQPHYPFPSPTDDLFLDTFCLLPPTYWVHFMNFFNIVLLSWTVNIVSCQSKQLLPSQAVEALISPLSSPFSSSRFISSEVSKASRLFQIARLFHLQLSFIDKWTFQFLTTKLSSLSWSQAHWRELFKQALKARSDQTAAYLDSHLLRWVLINQGDCSWESDSRWGSKTRERHISKRGKQRQTRKEDGGLQEDVVVPVWVASVLPRVLSSVWTEGHETDVRLRALGFVCFWITWLVSD